MLTLTSEVLTPMHRLPAALKLLLLAGFTFSLFMMTSPLVLAGAMAMIAGLYLSGGLRFARQGLGMLRPLWPFVAIVALWHGWTGDVTGGVAVILRMLTAVAAANLVTMTTRLSDMITVLETLALPFAPLLPPRRLALVIALVIRFIPVLGEKVGHIAMALRARSARRNGWRIIAPAALAALDDAEHVAEALRARGGA